GNNRRRRMKTRKRSIRKWATLLLMVTVAISATRQAPAEPRGDGLKLPQNTRFTLELLSPISTARNKKGDSFRCTVVEPIEYKSAIVDGELTKVKASGKASGKSEIAMGFRRITMPNGDTGKFQAQIAEVYEVT